MMWIRLFRKTHQVHSNEAAAAAAAVASSPRRRAGTNKKKLVVLVDNDEHQVMQLLDICSSSSSSSLCIKSNRKSFIDDSTFKNDNNARNRTGIRRSLFFLGPTTQPRRSSSSSSSPPPPPPHPSPPAVPIKKPLRQNKRRIWKLRRRKRTDEHQNNNNNSNQQPGTNGTNNMSERTQATVVAGDHPLEEEDVEEDCPICCEPMACGDVLYPLQCPTLTCRFNYCYDCIASMERASKEDYQIASDGSRQLKIKMTCPQCRSKYHISKGVVVVNNNNSSSNAVLPKAKISSTTYPSEIIVQSVLCLRETHIMCTSVLRQNDSNLKSSFLARKDKFLRTTSIETIQDAYRRLNVYHSEIGKSNDDGVDADKSQRPRRPFHIMPEPDWAFLKTQLPEKIAVAPTASFDSANGGGGSVDGRPSGTAATYTANSDNDHTSSSSQTMLSTWRDPTLFYGLDELMTDDEQEFVTQLLVSGKVELVLQATNILHGMMQMNQRDAAITTVQRLGLTGAAPQQQQALPQARRRPPQPPKSKKTIELHQRIRNRYPLPVQMPRCVSLPVYHPEHDKKPLLNFADTTLTTLKSLELKGVRGYAGQVGLRKGDIVTHVNGDAVTNYQEFKMAMLEAASIATNVLITVNAHEDTAAALRHRAQNMQKDKIVL